MPRHQNAGESTNEGYASSKSLETREVNPFEEQSYIPLLGEIRRRLKLGNVWFI